MRAILPGGAGPVVVRGMPGPDEVAAVLAVLTALAGPPSAGATVRRPPGAYERWRALRESRLRPGRPIVGRPRAGAVRIGG